MILNRSSRARRLQRLQERWPKRIFQEKVDSALEGWRVVWLGHASFLIGMGETRLIVDPVFKRWIGFFSRHLPLPDLSSEAVPEAVLLSHAHMDHFDSKEMKRIGCARMLLPRGSERYLARAVRDRALPLEAGQETSVGSVSIMPLPMRHGGWRYPWQQGCWACGYVLRANGNTLFLAGDSAYGAHFKEIGERFAIDLALLPIGAYSPRWFLADKHMNPEEACQAALDLGAKQIVPYHFGTYRLSLESLDEPIERFASEADRLGIEWRLPHGLSE